MANAGEFLQACANGQILVYCSECQDAKKLNDVENIDCIGNEFYWGDEPWWHDIRIFKCPDCGSVQESKIEYIP
ncbi:MAG: hypothetical protein JXQ81_01765 [Desulfuromonadales bacterium]|nr:hypothetical protein [Desulfuromonadales bacterium]MBN2791213.1 hypothetical protein [Desulfuromonadales bacterium]